MREMLQLDYYYGIEAEQFSFYRVPRLLIKDERFKQLSSDAKLLYGLMLDRMSMSINNISSIHFVNPLIFHRHRHTIKHKTI